MRPIYGRLAHPLAPTQLLWVLWTWRGCARPVAFFWLSKIFWLFTVTWAFRGFVFTEKVFTVGATIFCCISSLRANFVPSSCLASAIAAAKKPEARTLRTAATATIYWPMASLHAPKSFAAHALTHMAGTSVRLPIPAPGHAHTAVASALGAASSPWRRLELGRLQRRRRTPSTPLATWHTCRASPLQTRPIMSSLTSRRALP